jgi:ABC-type branched-subunit amino acid transport system substrate-binding protein
MFESNLRRMKQTFFCLLVMGTFLVSLLNVPCARADVVKIGLNYPKTGPYSVQGLDQWHATQLAAAEINAAGGILGKKVDVVWRDSMSKADVTTKNVTELIDKEGVKMVLGGSASSVAIAPLPIPQRLLAKRGDGTSSGSATMPGRAPKRLRPI